MRCCLCLVNSFLNQESPIVSLQWQRCFQRHQHGPPVPLSLRDEKAMKIYQGVRRVLHPYQKRRGCGRLCLMTLRHCDTSVECVIESVIPSDWAELVALRLPYHEHQPQLSSLQVLPTGRGITSRSDSPVRFAQLGRSDLLKREVERR